jgi:peptide/nickel transport system substrate-binding protein
MRMQSISRRNLLGGTAVAGAGLLSSLPYTPYWASAQDRSSAVFSYHADPASLDPTICSGQNCAYALNHIYEGLTQLDVNGNIVPSLAESWENPDPLTWVFHLRSGVKFHNGADLTAEDVKYSFERVLDPELPGSNLPYFSSIDTVDATDPLTVTFHLKSPYVPLLGSMSMTGGSILNRAWAEEQIAAGALEFTSATNGTGPYQLVEYVPGDRFDLAKFNEYWDTGTPKIDDVTWKIMQEMETRVASLRARTASFATVDAIASKQLESSDFVTLYNGPGFGMPVSIHNLRRAPYDNPLVRQAIAVGVDRQAVIDRVFNGDGSLTGPVPTNFGDWFVPVEELPYPTDKDRAKELLAEAGYPDGFDTVILGLDTFPYNDVGIVYQAELQSIGINASIEQTEFGAWLDKIHEFDFDTHVNGYGFNADPELILGRSFQCGSDGNFPGYCDEAYDALLLDLQSESDHAARVAVSRQMQDMLLESAPFIWWNTMYDYYATTDQITGYELAIHPYPRETFKKVSVVTES